MMPEEFHEQEEDDLLMDDDDDDAGDSALSQLWRSRNANARTLLGDLRLRAFLKAGLSFSDCAAFDLIYEAIARGEGLDILTKCGTEFGYVLRAEGRGDQTFLIEFGHRSEEGWNSGGEWLVRFNQSGSVDDVDLVGMWCDSV